MAQAKYKCTKCEQGFEWSVPAEASPAPAEGATEAEASNEQEPQKGICPSCSFRLSSRSHSRWLLMNAGLAGMALLLVVADPSPGFRWFLLNLTILNLLNFPAVILHELGHAVTAKAAGWGVYQVTIGWLGKPVYREKFGRTWVQLNSVPVGGMTYAYPRNERGLRAKAFLIFAAGPAVNAGAAAACYAWQSNFWVPFDQGLNLAAGFAIANLICVGVAIYPMRCQSPLGKTETDGLLLVKTLFRWRSLKPDFENAAAVMEALTLREENGRYPEALERIKALLEKKPEDPALRNYHAMFLMDNGRLEEAKGEWRQLWEGELPDPLWGAMLQNNMAWVNVLMGDPELVAESLALSESAMTGLGFMAAIKGTRGSVLIQAGRADEGLPLVKDSFYSKETVNLRDKSSNACMISIGEFQQGRQEEAARWLGIAKELDWESPLLARAESVLNGEVVSCKA